MYKKALLASLFFIATAPLFGQTLFSYGPYKVDTETFLQAYKKNNPDTVATGEASLKQYLDLYIASRLKIQEAYDRGYDTLPAIRTEMDGLRAQILPGYLNDPAAVDSLVQEAMLRSQQDIHLAHIFVSHDPANPGAGRKKINEAYEALQQGNDFATVARNFSADPSVVDNGGDLGYISAFSLPYSLENEAYKLGPSQVSAPFTSSGGFHIFKNLGERPSAGLIEARQILLAFPPQATEAEKKQAGLLADSLYQALQQGADFGELAKVYSNDNISAMNSGRMLPFTTGTYSPAFEEKVLSLKNNEVAAPFQTALGYHIVEKLSTTAVDPTDEATKARIAGEVSRSDRMQEIRKNKVTKVKNQAGFDYLVQTDDAFWRYTDSLTQGKGSGRPNTFSRQTPMLHIGNDTASIGDWIDYANVWRFKSDGSGMKDHQTLLDEFVDARTAEYYKTHLEEFSPAFRQQLAEFREGNLFFEIMQREIWDKSQQDTAALKRWYTSHKDQYQWGRSADAVLFFCTDSVTAGNFYTLLQKDPGNWKSLAASYGDKVVADSARYELDQLPLTGETLSAGSITAMKKNEMDQSRNFAYIVRIYEQPSPRSYEDAKGFVVQDYQAEMEKEWVAQLKKKYPVKVNKKAWKKLLASQQ